MLEHTRSSGLWFYILDPEKKEQTNVRLSAVRQELVCPLVGPVVVVSFGSYTVPYQLNAVPPTEADKDKCKPYATADGDPEIIMLFEASVGTNPALLFERCSAVVSDVVQGNHRPMGYKAYSQYQGNMNRPASSKLLCDYPASPTGKLGVWDVCFTRKFGLDKDNLFSKLSSQATYLTGYVDGVSDNMGSMYSFPAGFKLTTSVEGADFLGVMSNLLSVVKENDDLPLVENYLIR